VELFVSGKCLGLVENLTDCFPEAKWQRCVVHFYRNVWTAAPTGKVKEVAAMLKAIHVQEGAKAAKEKALRIVEKLRLMREIRQRTRHVMNQGLSISTWRGPGVYASRLIRPTARSD
jgi:transposase-like protein